MLSIDGIIKDLEKLQDEMIQKSDLVKKELDEYVEQYDNYNMDLEKDKEYQILSEKYEGIEKESAYLYDVLEEAKRKSEAPLLYELEDFEGEINYYNNARQYLSEFDEIFEVKEEKKLEDMSIEELSKMLIEHPEMANEIFAKTEDLLELYDEVSYPLDAGGDLGNLGNIDKIIKARETITEYILNDLHFASFEEYSDEIYANRQREELNRKYSVDKEVIREYDSSIEDLEQKEAELSSLETEEKTISEAEALIDRKNQKQGEQK